jgi:hypothetical protein
MLNRVLIFLLISLNSYAFTIVEEEVAKPFEMINTGKDAISWQVFAKTKEVEKCQIIEGFDDCMMEPIYSQEIKDLDGKKVTLMGYMFPLSAREKQKRFLLGPYPLSCPIHYHTSSALVVEVNSNISYKFSYDPLKITGILKVKYNRDTGIYYYLDS